MDAGLYPMIFKRKSFHLFRDAGKLDQMELDGIVRVFDAAVPLDRSIKIAMKIVPAEKTSCKRGQEFCILLYSEKRGSYLQNIGYIGEQLDLYLASRDIGALWFGLGKPDEATYNGLEFVIMLAIAKMRPGLFRKDLFKSRRKPLSEIWEGAAYQDIGNLARFAPSACNTQPWIVKASEKEIQVFRYEAPGKRGIMPKDRVSYYNRIDIGIFLLFLDLCLANQDISFEKTVMKDSSEGTGEIVPAAHYWIKDRAHTNGII
jgi:hypothetical protein